MWAIQYSKGNSLVIVAKQATLHFLIYILLCGDRKLAPGNRSAPAFKKERDSNISARTEATEEQANRTDLS